MTRREDTRPISVAVLAMGGQGGGVLADWIVQVAEDQGWVAQSTSVPGVAQRTGSTLYYIEMLRPKAGAAPVLSLMPAPGDVDLVLATEFAEAGRAILRGLVTPERTTLIASTHRALAVSEKQVPGDGVLDPSLVDEAIGVSVRRLIALDLESIAKASNSVISAAMLGAVAASGVLPFDRRAFEGVINKGGRGAQASLKAFATAYAAVGAPPIAGKLKAASFTLPGRANHPDAERLLARIRGNWPANFHETLYRAIERLTDYQDTDYAAEYLDRLDALRREDETHGGNQHDLAFTLAAAKYLCIAMSYDDVIQVADLKTRSSRFALARNEVKAADGNVVELTEFMHPRIEEIIGTLPVGLADWIEARPSFKLWLARRIDKGRRVRTTSLGWFLMLYGVSGLKRYRRRLARHQREMAHVEQWLHTALNTLPRNYPLAVEVLNCRRLVKGYSDTHARGLSKYDRVLSALPRLIGREDGADWLKRLRDAALRDEEGKALEGALKTVESL